MPVSLAYVTVIIIWATSPLGIVWSTATIEPASALLLRMGLAALTGITLMLILGIKLCLKPKSIQAYAFSSLSMGFGLLCCYIASKYIPSGLMALIFGVGPIFAGYFARIILSEEKFTTLKQLSLLISLIGLGVVCMDNISRGNNTLLGIFWMLSSVILFSLSSVLVKSVKVQLHPLTTTTGSILICFPLYLLSWWLMDGNLNYQDWSSKSIASAVYLGVVGTLIGFLAYYYILQKLSATTVAIVVMITPVLSTALGVLVNGEPFSWNLFVGASLIVFGLSIFQFGHKFKAMLSAR